MNKEYILKVTDEALSNAFSLFEAEYPSAQELVRCKDCKHFRSEVKDEFTTFFGCSKKHDTWGKNWFCPDGERE